jgi:hypothetical protein
MAGPLLLVGVAEFQNRLGAGRANPESKNCDRDNNHIQ